MSFPGGPLPPVKGNDRDTKVTKGFHVPGPNAGKTHHRALVRQVHSNIYLREKYDQLTEPCIGGITTNPQARTCMKRLKSSLGQVLGLVARYVFCFDDADEPALVAYTMR